MPELNKAPKKEVLLAKPNFDAQGLNISLPTTFSKFQTTRIASTQKTFRQNKDVLFQKVMA